MASMAKVTMQPSWRQFCFPNIAYKVADLDVAFADDQCAKTASVNKGSQHGH
jgi:hypothetical protein